MTFWEDFSSTVLALLTVAAISTLAAWTVVGFKRRVIKRPDFTLDRTARGWKLTRTGRRPALHIVHGQGWVGGGSLTLMAMSPATAGDLAHDEEAFLDLDSDTVWFTWIDRQRRYAKTLELRGGVEHHDVFAAAEPLVQTSHT